jgi:DNA-binding transcriptional LysR family regulator
MKPAPTAAAPLSWDLLGAFLAVMRAGSLSGASRSLGVAQPTVRRQIETLEEVLGGALFTRSQTGLTPTEMAVATLPYAESMAAVAEALVRSASAPANAEQGTVRVTCSELVGVGVLPVMLASLCRAHPQLQIELSPSDANEDLLRRDADVAVRMAKPTQAALVAKHIGAVKLGFFARGLPGGPRGPPLGRRSARARPPREGPQHLVLPGARGRRTPAQAEGLRVPDRQGRRLSRGLARGGRDRRMPRAAGGGASALAAGAPQDFVRATRLGRHARESARITPGVDRLRAPGGVARRVRPLGVIPSDDDASTGDGR